MKALAPTPWRIDTELTGRNWKNSLSVVDADGGEVAILTRGYEGDDDGNDCPSWTNGRLIAAAPDLLEALKDLAIAADTAELLLREQYPARAQSMHQRVDVARAAIVKAEGRKDA